MGQTKTVRAGTGERAQFLVHEFNDNTIRFVLHYPGAVDREVLSAATRAVVMSVDILHGSFLYDGRKACWQIGEPAESDYFRYIETEDDPICLGRELALRPVPLESPAKLHTTLIRGQESCCLTVLISHLCVDGGDGKYLLGKLAEAYDLILTTGSADGLAVKNGSREPRQVYEHLSLKDKLSLIRVPFSGVKSEFPYPTGDPGEHRLVQRVIPAGVMDEARNRARGSNATVNDLVLTAYYRAYASLNGVDAARPMAIAAMMDVRRHCETGDSEGLCNLSGSLATVLEHGVSGSFSHTLTQIARQTRAAKAAPLAGLEGVPLLYGAARRLPLPLLLKLVGLVYRNMNLGVTNLGNLPCRDFALGGLVPTGGMAGGPLKKKPGMQVTVISFDGSCALTVVGRFTARDQQLLDRMLDQMVLEITTYAQTEAASPRQRGIKG